MDTVEIDPELFITCRICLNEKGSFQITPVVQHQIKYCLDFEVQPFDGYSQVICKNCKPVLQSFYNLKKNFKEKQKNFKKNANVYEITKEQADQYVVTSSQQEESTDKADLKVKIKRLKNRENVRSSLCSESESDTNSLKTFKNIEIQFQEKFWEHKYQKYFVCRYCDTHRKSLSSISEHLIIHKKILCNYKDFIQRHCNVSLNRIDHLPNYTGKVTDTNIVVLDMKTFIYDGNNINYYVTYLPKAYQNLSSTENTIHEITSDDGSVRKNKNDDSSDEESIRYSRPPQKRARFMSDSDTSLSGVNIKHESYNTQIISENIPKDVIKMNPQLTNSQKEYIRTLVLESCNKSIKKNYSHKMKINNDVLNRKVLNIGRRVMSKQGLQSPGLLKYLEYKNLSIEWTPNNMTSMGWKENYYVRIMTNIKEKPQNDNFVYLNEIDKIDLKELPSDSRIDNDTCKSLTDATISKTKKSDNILKTFLLNTNPVANPKQAPLKKVFVNSIPQTSDNMQVNFHSESTSELICLNDSDEDRSSDVMSQLPIITSTTSLAPNANLNVVQNIPPSSIASYSAKVNDVAAPEQPRIKCKPVSELMSAKKFTPSPHFLVVDHTKGSLNLGIISQSSVIHTPTVIQAPTVISCIKSSSSSTGASNSVALPKSMPILPTSVPANDCITLDTGLMPNTSTSSPINYFKNLIHSYDLVLVDSLNDCKSFCCLVKFKLNIKHDNKSVLLNLGLFALKNTFCIRVRNGNTDFIDILQMSANWQWELIRAFQDNTVLEKAQSMSDAKSASEHTQLFISILKSIKKKPNQ